MKKLELILFWLIPALFFWFMAIDCTKPVISTATVTKVATNKITFTVQAFYKTKDSIIYIASCTNAGDSSGYMKSTARQWSFTVPVSTTTSMAMLRCQSINNDSMVGSIYVNGVLKAQQAANKFIFVTANY